MESWMPFFVIVTATAVVLQAIVLIALFLQLRRTAARVEETIADLNTRITPILSRVQFLVEDATPRIAGIVADAAELTRMARSQAQKVDRILSETLERMEKATVLLMTKDARMANRFIQEKEQISTQYRSVRKRHLEQLTAGQKFDVNFFDMLNCLRRINSHLTAVAYSITRTSSAGRVDDTTAVPDPDETWLTGDDSSIDRKTCAVIRSESFVN